MFTVHAFKVTFWFQEENKLSMLLNILLRILKYPYSAYVLKQGFEKMLTTVVKEGGL